MLLFSLPSSPFTACWRRRSRLPMSWIKPMSLLFLMHFILGIMINWPSIAPACFSAWRIAIKSEGAAPTSLTARTKSSSVKPGSNLNILPSASVTSISESGTTTVWPPENAFGWLTLRFSLIATVACHHALPQRLLGEHAYQPQNRTGTWVNNDFCRALCRIEIRVSMAERKTTRWLIGFTWCANFYWSRVDRYKPILWA